MPLEIERKFLLANDDWKSSVVQRIRICDGLIASDNGNKARVRIVDSNATIALKSRRQGPTRTEFEYTIPYSDAVEILRTMCDGRVLDKVRHVITHAIGARPASRDRRLSRRSAPPRGAYLPWSADLASWRRLILCEW